MESNDEVPQVVQDNEVPEAVAEDTQDTQANEVPEAVQNSAPVNVSDDEDDIVEIIKSRRFRSGPMQWDLNECRKIARKYIERGKNREETYNSICQEKTYTVIDPELLTEWFHRFHNDSTFHDDQSLHDSQYNLVELIADEYQKKTYSLCTWQAENLNLINERYAVNIQLDSSDRPSALLLYDNFYGEKREIPIVKKKNMKTKACQNFLSINLEYSLLVYNNEMFNRTVPATTLIYLLKLDLQTAECRVVDKTEFDGDWKQICYDIKNSSKFAFILDRGHECVYYGEIENSRIKFNQDIALFGESDKFCGLNLMNGKFYGFNVDRINRNNAENNEVNRENQDVDYVELHAENGRIVSRILRTIRPRNAKDFNKTIVINHFRHNQLKYDVCGTTYFFPVWIGDGNNCMLYKFDMVTNELTRIGTHIVANILEMDVNEDGFMTVLSSNQMYDTTVYRFAVKTPDTLQNLSVFAVCRQLTPTDTSRYSLIKDLMPNRLQAFDLFAPQPLKRKQKTKKPKKETTTETVELRRSSRIQSAPSSSNVDEEQVSKRVKTS